VYQNTSLAHREYQGMVFQASHRFSNRWTMNGHYTVQFKNDGNYEGEARNEPGKTSLIGDYPEAFNAQRYFPDGRLQDFQRHRLRIWSVYNVPMNQYGDLSISGLWRVDSARVYSLTTTVAPSATQEGILEAAGYPDLPNVQSNPGPLYFSPRGSES